MNKTVRILLFFLVYTARSWESKMKPVYRCGGSLISTKHVVTAGHCIEQVPKYLMVAVRVGEKIPDESNVFKPVLKILHPKYSVDGLKNDIGIVKLDREVTFSDVVRPICLPFDETNLSRNKIMHEPLIIAGWGITDRESSHSIPNNLHFATMYLMNQGECSKTLGERYTLTEKQICTRPFLGKDSCSGDSGGPLFLPSNRNRSAALIGIVSFGPRECGNPKIPSVFTDVRSYRNFLLDNMY